MKQDRSDHVVPNQSLDELARAQQEKQELAQQVKLLIKSESKLYEFQERLDAQLKEYKNLHELSRKLTTTLELGRIFEHALEYLIYSLQYERALILQSTGLPDIMTVRAFEGFYGEKEKKCIESFTLHPDDGSLSPLKTGFEYLICEAGGACPLAGLRERLLMDEFVIYPLGACTHTFTLLIAGNSLEHAAFHRRVLDHDDALLGIGNLTGLLSASLENHTLYAGMEKALEQERKAEEAVRALNAELKKKNDELAVANKRMINFFNTVSDGVMIVDRQERVVELNPAAKGMLGRKAQSVVGVPFNALIDQRTSPKSGMQPTHEAFTDVEIMMDSQDGACHCLASGEPILNELGEVTGGLVILRPIQQVQNLVHRFSGHYATLQFEDVIGESDGIREAVRLAKLTATTTSNVLLEGESGTGKEIFAQAIHNRSSQHNGPFIALNCGAIPRELIASELFGYEEGSFTGAKRGGKPGKFELASGGTLFLDEIGDMPLEQQSSLLRVIQEKKVARIGSDKMISVQVRLICASNKNLLGEVERGAFRHDLYYRLNVMSIMIPPLRERRTDIPLLFNHFLEKIGCDRGTRFQVNLDVYDYLAEYSWPGNVRELQNVVERAASLAENGVISVRQLPVELYSPLSCIQPAEQKSAVQIDSPRSVTREQRQKTARESEKMRIIELLNQHAGNVSRVAREIGVSRKTMYNKMKTYEINN
jgi:sigma-54 dependent transcriptional regulator, acetoin dehydrogenase operon transcriptional activator AcoR